ncbi:L-lactate permease [Cryptosporangium aurantiacum]|uniref:L-lactate permease n=1 Tax=Cryptosporangium aurantiacum TaxID=134849 RepID=A0A1M7QFF7_9ACTN|nr:L-lactate permease [Cryptosporangium aurantiacum]SHN29716.1 lactate permease [Cryptosporangium aurantiacum]
MYQQVLDPVANSLAWSSLVAAIPLVVLFILLGVFRMRAWLASLIALAVALVVAIGVYGMPAGQALLATSEGAAFGFFPILWIVINAIWVYNITVETGHFDVLRRSFTRVSDDRRIQAIIIAFSFGALIEALAGFGTPVAVTSVMLMALGFSPLKSAVLALTANTAPVAFGAMATPILTLGTVTDISSDTLGAMVGRQTPILAIFVPLVLVFIVDGARGLRETWVFALVCGATFGIGQYVTSNFISVPLADVVASLLSVAALVGIVRVWRPIANPVTAEALAAERPGQGSDDADDERDDARTPTAAGRDAEREPVEDSGGAAALPDTRAEIARAYAPYAIIIAVFVVCQIGPVKEFLERATQTISWPGLNLTNTSGEELSLVAFKLNWLTTPGTQMLVAGLLTMLALKVSVGRALRAYGVTLDQLKWAILTVMTVLGLAFIMNASGQTVTLGTWMAGAGGLFALISPILGWLGVAVTGSDTSSNSLFGALQVTAAERADLSATLMAASNSSGGVLGKMISPQNLAIAAAAVGLQNSEGDIFRRVVGWSVVFLAGICLLSWLQSTAVLAWMVP